MKSKNIDKQQQHKTSDLYMAVWFSMHDYYFTVEKIAGSRKKFFIFNEMPDSEAKRMTQEYYQNEFLQEFINKLREAKNRLYEDEEPVIYNKK